MRAYEIKESFGLENLRSTTRPDPEPGPGQVLVRTKAVSLNYRDLMMVRGHYNPRQPLPLIPCSDGAGVVEAVGSGAARFAVGDRVMTCFSQTWLGGPPDHERIRGTLGGPLDGTLVERLVLDEDGLVATPSHLSDVQAACLPCAALTAWSALVTEGNIRAGDIVLLQGTGGVSIFALQIASMLGARAIVTSSSNEKRARAEALGAWRTLNYREDPTWAKTVRAMTGGRGVDLVVEVGGAGTLGQSLDAARIGGTVAVIGVLSGVSSELSVIPVLMKQLRLQGILVGNRDGFETMNRAIEAVEMEPVVDRVFAFEDAREAFETMASAAHFGKIVIQVE